MTYGGTTVRWDKQIQDMELVSFGKEVLQNLAEQAASYRLGQSALRHLDRALWVVEKCARWAVPPPLDQDERPQPELVRPLPWVFFLALLITLRVTRESISLVNLVMGKPPLRSADVVTYIQSKRRYLRTLKYQGSRMMRARSTPAQPARSWYSRVLSLLELTMCFRRHSHNYGNNNTTHVSNNDEVLVVKRSKRVRPGAAGGAAAGDSTMERLIEKMMIDLDADSDDDSSFTLTNVTSVRSDTDMADSDQETILQNDESPSKTMTDRRPSIEIDFSPNRSAVSTPERVESPPKQELSENNTSTKTEEAVEMTEDALPSPAEKLYSPKEETKLFLQSEISSRSPKSEQQKKTGTKELKAWSVKALTKSIMKHKHAKEIGLNSDRRDSDLAVSKSKSTDKTM